jgi:hypothetical protein
LHAKKKKHAYSYKAPIFVVHSEPEFECINKFLVKLDIIIFREKLFHGSFVDACSWLDRHVRNLTATLMQFIVVNAEVQHVLE